MLYDFNMLMWVSLWCCQKCFKGEFATQTCFQGKFGEELGSDQFGGCIMFHAPVPGANMVIGRLEYVEVRAIIINSVPKDSRSINVFEFFLCARCDL